MYSMINTNKSLTIFNVFNIKKVSMKGKSFFAEDVSLEDGLVDSESENGESLGGAFESSNDILDFLVDGILDQSQSRIHSFLGLENYSLDEEGRKQALATLLEAD